MTHSYPGLLPPVCVDVADYPSMIGRLTGIVAGKQPPSLLLDVNGVGYEVEAPMSTFYVLPEVGEKTTLMIHTHVREDALLLFGFASTAERFLFRALMKVSGIGARLALTILSGISVQGFAACIQNEDSDALMRLPGVGKKTAQRLVMEMKDRLAINVEGKSVELRADIQQPPTPSGEAVTALIALGYKANEASRMVRAVQGDAASTEEIIRLALQAAVRK